MITINENGLYHVSILEKEFVNIFHKYFPKSKISTGVSGNLRGSMSMRFFLGGEDRSEYENGIPDNDPMLSVFYIDLDGKIDKDKYIISNKLPLKLIRGRGVRLEDDNSGSSYIDVPFRKTTGDKDKLYKAFETYVAKLQKEVIKHAERIKVPFDIYDKLPRSARPSGVKRL